jgi:hypothetical protein
MLSPCLQAPTESQVVRAQADNATLSRAHQLLEEEKDEVKHMNQMVQYAKCVAVRDKQMQVSIAARCDCLVCMACRKQLLCYMQTTHTAQ